MLQLTIKDRLNDKARQGLIRGFSLRLWPNQVKRLEREGIVLRNPKPTARKGEIQYEIDFSLPRPGTLSEELYNFAMQSRPMEDCEDPSLIEPLHLPYSID